MTEEQHSVDPSLEAAGDGAIVQRVFGRLVRSPGVIPPGATRDLPERVTRLARRRLPLLDALQRRWGSSLDASWPEASRLPLVIARAGRLDAEAGLTRLDTATAIDQRNSSSLPMVIASRSSGQGASAPLAPLMAGSTNYHSDSPLAVPGRPLPVVQAQPAPGEHPPHTSALQRQSAVTGGGPAERTPRQGDSSGSGSGSDLALLSDNTLGRIELHPLRVARAQPLPVEQSPMTSSRQRGGSLTGGGSPERSPAQGEASGDEAVLASPVENPPRATEQSLPVARAQPLPVRQSLMTSTLQRGDSVTGGGPAEVSPGQGERGGDEPDLNLSASNAPAMTEQPLPVACAQPLPVRQPTATSSLQRQVGVTGGQPTGSRVQHSSSEPEESSTANKSGTPISANRGQRASASEVGQASALGRSSASGVTRVWGEPIVQRLRGSRKATETDTAPASTSRSGQVNRAEGAITTPIIARTRAAAVSTEPLPSVRRSDVGTGVGVGDGVAESRAGEPSTTTMPLQGVPGAMTDETAPSEPRIVVKPEPAAEGDTQPVHRATAEIGYSLPFSPPHVSLPVGLKRDATEPGVPGPDTVAMAAALGGMPDRRPLPLVKPEEQGPAGFGSATTQVAQLGGGSAVRRDTVRTGFLAGPKGRVTRRATVDEAGLGRRVTAGRDVDAPAGRVAELPVVAVPAAGSEMIAHASPEPELVWSSSQPAMPSDTPFHSLSTPVQRQGNNATRASSSSAVPDGAHASPSAAAPGEGQAAARAGPAGEGRVRLDELEMERVANNVLEKLRQRLQMEREARGL